MCGDPCLYTRIHACTCGQQFEGLSGRSEMTWVWPHRRSQKPQSLVLRQNSFLKKFLARLTWPPAERGHFTAADELWAFRCHLRTEVGLFPCCCQRGKTSIHWKMHISLDQTRLSYPKVISVKTADKRPWGLSLELALCWNLCRRVLQGPCRRVLSVDILRMSGIPQSSVILCPTLRTPHGHLSPFIFRKSMT